MYALYGNPRYFKFNSTNVFPDYPSASYDYEYIYYNCKCQDAILSFLHRQGSFSRRYCIWGSDEESRKYQAFIKDAL